MIIILWYLAVVIYLKVKCPFAFQPDDIVEHKTFHFSHTPSSYYGYVKKLEEKNHPDAEHHSYSRAENKPFLRMPDLTKCGNTIYSECNKPALYCDGVRFRLFNVFEEISYINAKIKFFDDVIVKKSLLIHVIVASATQCSRRRRILLTKSGFSTSLYAG